MEYAYSNDTVVEICCHPQGVTLGNKPPSNAGQLFRVKIRITKRVVGGLGAERYVVLPTFNFLRTFIRSVTHPPLLESASRCFACVVLNGGVPRMKTMRMNGAVFQVVRARNVCS